MLLYWRIQFQRYFFLRSWCQINLGRIVGDLEKYKSQGLGTVHLKNLTYDLETAYHFEELNWNGYYDSH